MNDTIIRLVLQTPLAHMVILTLRPNGNRGKPGIVCLLTEPSGVTVGRECILNFRFWPEPNIPSVSEKVSDAA